MILGLKNQSELYRTLSGDEYNWWARRFAKSGFIPLVMRQYLAEANFLTYRLTHVVCNIMAKSPKELKEKMSDFMRPLGQEDEVPKSKVGTTDILDNSVLAGLMNNSREKK